MKIPFIWTAIAAGLALLPVVLPSNYYLGIMIFIGLNSLAAMGLCLLMGYAGQISLGHAAFFGMGAYISGILSVSYGSPPWLSVIAAITATALLAFVLGVPILRLQGYYLAVATLGLGIIVYLVFMNWTSLTGGPSGLSAIPYLALGPLSFNRDLKVYYLVWAVVFLALACGHNIVKSRVGRALRSIHSSEIAAQAMGINTGRYKVKVFALSAAYAALAGGLYAHYLTFISPAPFGFQFSIELLVMVVVGGIGDLSGAILGAAVITLLSEILRDLMPHLFSYGAGEYEIVFFGILLIVFMIFLPGGLVQGLDFLRRRPRVMAQR